jgi:UDP-3-O-[3-hydroxymyristoyl] glucosamine N-acyltransferase
MGIGIVTFVANDVGWDIARVGEVPTDFLKASVPTVRDDQWLDLFLAAVPLALLASAAEWLPHVRSRPVVPATASIHPQASVIGHVVLGDNGHIAAGSSVRADEGTPFFIGPNTNIQDGVVIHALKQKTVTVGGKNWAVSVGRNVSMAHDALVHGPCYVGDAS